MKKTKDNNIIINNNNGITLISLIFTIIVIMLIAAINISILFGDNGVIAEAVHASERKKETDMLDDINFTWSALEIKYLSQGSNISKQEFIKNNLKTSLSLKGEVYEDSIKSTATGGTIFKFKSNSNNKTYNILRNSTGQFSIVGEYDKLSNIIKPENYGDYVNYSAGGVDSWRIFYNDSDNIFIITTNYLHKNNLPPITKISSPYSHTIQWSSLSSPTSEELNIIKNASKYSFNWELIDSFNNDASNLSAVSDLLNHNNWKNFVHLDFAIGAIGTPTVEMFKDSWCSKYNSNTFSLIQATNSSTGYRYGYIFEYQPTNIRGGVLPDNYLLNSQEQTKKLYFPYNTYTIDDASGYWLASSFSNPNNSTNQQLLYINANRLTIMGGNATTNDNNSIRPVVCLNSDVYGLKTESGWELIK